MSKNVLNWPDPGGQMMDMTQNCSLSLHKGNFPEKTSYEILSREPMWSQKITIMQKNSGIGLGVYLQLSFSSFEKNPKL